MRRLSTTDVLAALLTVAATVTYTWINLERLGDFAPLQWDLAIFGQGLWKLSRGETPYVTIRGLHLFGEHATYTHLLLAPLFRVWSSVSFLVVVQSFALAISAFLLFRVAAERLGRGVAAFLVLIAYLLYPPLQHSWFEYYQPDALAIPCLIAAWWAVERGRLRNALLWAGVAILTKENVAATTFALGLYAFARGRRRIGILLATTSLVYLLAVMAILFPLFNPGQGYVYSDRLYGEFASNLPGAALYLSSPANLWQRLGTAENGRYLADLLLPLGGLPLGAPLLLVPAAQLPLNLVSSWPYARQVHYHYTLLVVPFLFLALVKLLESLKKRPFRLGFACGLLATATCVSQYGVSPLPDAIRTLLAARQPAARAERSATQALLRAIPAGATVSAHYRFLPFLCLRNRLYMLPALGPEGDPPQAVIADLGRLRPDPREQAVARWLLGGGLYEIAGRTPGRAVLFLRKDAADQPTARTP